MGTSPIRIISQVTVLLYGTPPVLDNGFGDPAQNHAMAAATLGGFNLVINPPVKITYSGHNFKWNTKFLIQDHLGWNAEDDGILAEILQPLAPERQVTRAEFFISGQGVVP